MNSSIKPETPATPAALEQAVLERKAHEELQEVAARWAEQLPESSPLGRQIHRLAHPVQTFEVPIEDRVQMHQICRDMLSVLLEGGELRWPRQGDEERLRVFILGGLVEVLDAIGWEVSDGTGVLRATPAVRHALTYVTHDLRVSYTAEDSGETDQERQDKEAEVELFRRWVGELTGAEVQTDPRMQSAEAGKAAGGRS